MAREESEALLKDNRPAFIFCDEADSLKSHRAACTRRISRYLKGVPHVISSFATGTPTLRSIRDYSHYVIWALGNKAPVPKEYETAQQWGMVLDERKGIQKLQRMQPGMLKLLCDTPETYGEYINGKPIQAVRKAFRDRLIRSPGVVATFEDKVATKLSIRPFYVNMPESIAVHYAAASKGDLPDGMPMMEAPHIWRAKRQISLGFFYRTNPAPPSEWLEPRRTWAAFVREVLKGSRTWDTEKQVASAVLRGDIDGACYFDWVAVRDRFEPQREAIWLASEAMDAVEGWAKQGPGIIWVEHVAVGKCLEQHYGLPFFHTDGIHKASGKYIEDADGVIVASTKSNATGRNLQTKWHRNLIVSAEPTGRVWEQMLGRTHRDGQPAPEVTVDVLMSSGAHWAAWRQAQLDAIYAEQTTGQAQKALYAESGDMPKAPPLRGPMW